MKRASLGVVIGAVVAMTAAAAHAQQASAVAPARRCSELTGFTLQGTNLRIDSAEPVPAAAPGTVKPSPFGPPLAVGVPAYCMVKGAIDPRTGVDGKAYALRFALALPDDWNGRFLFQGGGGLNGTVNPPFGAQAAGAVPALARGFAVVSTDSGHEGQVFDDAFMKDQEAALNFAQDSVGTVTPIAKRIVAAYYGRAPAHSYFAGCSTGGREAMLSAERYPNYFDGIVSGDPAMRTGYSNLGLAWMAAAFNKAAPKDASGKPLPGQLFSPSDRKLLVSSLLAACDGLDGMKDGLIFDFGACHFDPAVLTCKGAKTDACLSPAQVETLKTAFAGPKTAGGVQVYPGFPYDTGIVAEGRQGIPGIVTAGPMIPVGGPNTATSMNVDKAAAKVAADGEQALIDTANWTNLTTFFGHGGKILFFHGLSDPWFSPYDTLGYYRRLADANGGVDAVRSSSRIYLVPGMGHCQGGPATLDQFDLLTAVVDWVEKGSAPDSVVATGASMPGVSRPLCAWPDHAQYSGAGDPKAAASYACRR